MKMRMRPVLLQIPCSRNLLKERYRGLFDGMDRYMKNYLAAMHRRTDRKTAASRCAD